MVAHARIANEIGTIAATTRTNWVDPAYDAAGNMTKRADPDDLGTDTAAHLMTYDAWNRLVKITDNAPGTPATIAEYEYDGLGRRIEKTVGSDTWDYYHSSSWQVIEVRRDTDSTKGGDPDTDPMEVFVYHPYYIDAVAVRYWDDPDDGGGLDGTWARHYYLHDAQYNVIAIVNDSNTILERYRYAPYGEQTVMDASYSTKSGGTDYGQYKGFTGQTLDPESGLVDFRTRLWHTGIGWVQRDKGGYVDGLNLYGGYFSLFAGMDPNGQTSLFGRDQLPRDTTRSEVKRVYGHPCWLNCNDAYLACRQNGGSRGRCQELEGGCLDYCYSTSRLQMAVLDADLPEDTDTDLLQRTIAAGGVAAEAVGGNLRLIAEEGARGLSLSARASVVLQGAGHLAGAAGQLSEIHGAAQNIDRFRGRIQDIAVTRAHREVWDGSLGEYIPDWGEDFDAMRGYCHIKGSAFSGMFKGGFLTETGAARGNSAQRTRGFYVTSCRTGEITFYYRVGVGAEWNKAIGEWGPGTQGDWGKVCLMPDEIFVLDMQLIGP